jgi:hypothetical protein
MDIMGDRMKISGAKFTVEIGALSRKGFRKKVREIAKFYGVNIKILENKTIFSSEFQVHTEGIEENVIAAVEEIYYRYC